MNSNIYEFKTSYESLFYYLDLFFAFEADSAFDFPPDLLEDLELTLESF